MLVEADDGFTRPSATVRKTRGLPPSGPSSRSGETQLPPPRTTEPEAGLSNPLRGSADSQTELDVEPFEPLEATLKVMATRAISDLMARPTPDMVPLPIWCRCRRGRDRPRSLPDSPPLTRRIQTTANGLFRHHQRRRGPLPEYTIDCRCSTPPIDGPGPGHPSVLKKIWSC